MAPELTVTASDFKARCLDLLDRLARRELVRVEVTRSGRVVAVLTPPEPPADFAALHGFMRGSVRLPENLDLAAPILDEPLTAEGGEVHG